MNVRELNERIADELVLEGASRRTWLVFCVGVEHATEMARLLRERGVACECILGETPSAKRASVLLDYREGALRAVTNVGVLTTGFNNPRVDLIALLRPTKSAALYVQMVGRGTRNADGKTSCLVLDFAGNVSSSGVSTARIRWRILKALFGV